MIKVIFNLLQQDDFYVGDPDIDFAKGSNKIPTTLKQAVKLIKRKIKKAWQTK